MRRMTANLHCVAQGHCPPALAGAALGFGDVASLESGERPAAPLLSPGRSSFSAPTLGERAWTEQDSVQALSPHNAGPGQRFAPGLKLYFFLLMRTRLRAPVSSPRASMQWVEQLMHGS
ncbi:hypothetical protein JCM14124_14390 [Humidesulfovibrio idahonensis]